MATITGAHSIIYSRKPAADRALLRDVFKLPSVDVGGGWLIFGLPPAELAVHPSPENDIHEFYLMCDNVEKLIAELRAHDVTCSPVTTEEWGLLTRVMLPGGGKLGVYEPRHPRPSSIPGRKAISISAPGVKRKSRGASRARGSRRR